MGYRVCGYASLNPAVETRGGGKAGVGYGRLLQVLDAGKQQLPILYAMSVRAIQAA